MRYTNRHLYYITALLVPSTRVAWRPRVRGIAVAVATELCRHPSRPPLQSHSVGNSRLFWLGWRFIWSDCSGHVRPQEP